MEEMVEKLVISVIIPTYNRANLIPRAIASVREQSYQDLEIIVVDDASEDDTARVIQQIHDYRIKYIRHQTNYGGSEARNTGIKNARGKYIAFLDSDDVWLPDKLSSQLAAISQQDDRDNLVCYGQFEISPQVFHQKSILPQKGKQPDETIADYFWLSRGEMLTSTLLISRTLAEATLFNSKLVKHQDLDFVLRLEQQGAKFIFVPQVLAIWHNEPRKDRISRLADYQLSSNWIQEWESRVSKRAAKGFLIKEVVPKLLISGENRVYATKLIVEAAIIQAISIPKFLFLIVQVAIAGNFRQYLKATIKKIGLIR